MIKNLTLFLFLGLLTITQSYSFWSLKRDSCSNFDNENACHGSQTNNSDSWANRAFQTPPRGDPLWRESYQDYNILVGYARVVYSGSGANIFVITRVNPAYSNLRLKYRISYIDIYTVTRLLTVRHISSIMVPVSS